MKPFYRLLFSLLIVGTTNTFVWFALTYWIYLQTSSVIATGILGGSYVAVLALSSFWLGSIVDHHKKKNVLLGSSIVTFFLYVGGFLLFQLFPQSVFTSVSSPYLWIFAITLLLGVLSGGLYNIAIPTLVTILVPEHDRDKANGLVGTISGIGFAITSVASGLAIGFGGMNTVLLFALLFTIVGCISVYTLPLEEKHIVHLQTDQPKKLDIKGTIKIIRSIPGLFALIFFTTFNNLIGGVFMALMDAYGLSLVSVQVWGILWGFLSMGFILGGTIIAKYGLGANPLKTLFRINIIVWITSIFFTIQPSIVLLSVGILIWITLMPFIEATEQTIIQKVVPVERQGRVFGIAHSIEQSASPLTAFIIGPITQLFFIPFMTTGAGVQFIGDWYGTGQGRGIALVFSMAGILGLCITLIAMRSHAYKLLAQKYKE